MKRSETEPAAEAPALKRNLTWSAGGKQIDVYRTDSQLVEDYASEMLFAGCPQHPSVAYGAAMDSFFVDPTAFRAKQEFSGGWAGDILIINPGKYYYVSYHTTGFYFHPGPTDV